MSIEQELLLETQAFFSRVLGTRHRNMCNHTCTWIGVLVAKLWAFALCLQLSLTFCIEGSVDIWQAEIGRARECRTLRKNPSAHILTKTLHCGGGVNSLLSWGDHQVAEWWVQFDYSETPHKSKLVMISIDWCYCLHWEMLLNVKNEEQSRLITSRATA